MSLRLRLMLSVGAVVLASIAAIALSSSRIMRVELDQFIKRQAAAPMVDSRLIADRLRAHRDKHGWSGVDALLRELRTQHFRRSELVLVDREGRVIAATIPNVRTDRLPRGGVQFDLRRDGGRMRLMVNRSDVQVGDAALYILPSLQSPGRLEAVRAVNRWLLGIVIAVGLAALAWTAILARNIVRPVEQLQAAVQRIEAGGRGHRVEITSHDEVGKLAEAFNAMSEQLARDEVLRRNLVNDVAHELRTPLTNLVCTVEALQDGLRAPERAVIDSLHDDLILLQRLVDDLQTLSLAEAGKLPLRFEVVEVRELLERFGGEAPSGLRINVDRMRFQQIVANLVGNAETHGGGAPAITARAADGEVEIAVADRGPGIPPEHLPHVFDRFYRADPSRDRATGGAGLGLAIVKQLVELQGGRVEVESAAGSGTTFRLRFPSSP